MSREVRFFDTQTDRRIGLVASPGGIHSEAKAPLIGFEDSVTVRIELGLDGLPILNPDLHK
jgi:hypothetical protein